MTWLNGRLEAFTADITTFSADAIVNAANSTLLGGGGVDGAIHRVGGPSILAECRRIRETRYPRGLPAGEAVITGGGRLPCRYVIHTVGPVWKDGRSGEDKILSSAYRNSLDKAAEVGARSVAFPAISTGVYGYPEAEAAKVVWRVLSARLHRHTLPEKVILLFFSESGLTVFLDNVPPPDVP
jgi:O-acetyl-ADP-ribose deacetylase (regulator of RNase III)